MSAWREQYERMKRWGHTIAHDPVDPERVPDILFAFANACYHMVDWLENDSSQPVRRGEADRHVSSSAMLSFCHEICNGAKHARLQEKNVELSVGMSDVGEIQETLLTGETRRRNVMIAKLFLDWEGAPMLAVEFADRCIAEWDRLLYSKGLL